jgi:hypothetical protein
MFQGSNPLAYYYENVFSRVGESARARSCLCVPFSRVILWVCVETFANLLTNERVRDLRTLRRGTPTPNFVLCVSHYLWQ